MKNNCKVKLRFSVEPDRYWIFKADADSDIHFLKETHHINKHLIIEGF